MTRALMTALAILLPALAMALAWAIFAQGVNVKLPLAMPVVMLGLNQTIMASLTMVVIAAMVGTRDLGQQVYIALGKANAGLGLTSGLAIALVAMMADRIIRGWAARRGTRDALAP